MSLVSNDRPKARQLDDRHRVERGPRRHVCLRQLERGIFRREGVRREPGIHAVRVRLQDRTALRRDRGQRAHGCATQSERPQRDVTLERTRPKELGQCAVRLPPARIHLEQPVLRVQIADHEVRVVLALREDVRDTERIAQHLHRPLEARDLDGLGLGLGPVRQRCAGQDKQCRQCQERNPRLGHGIPLDPQESRCERRFSRGREPRATPSSC
jgi:hypothetical protein